MTNIIFFTILLMVSYQDLKKRTIPDLYILFILLTGIISHFLPELENLFPGIQKEFLRSVSENFFENIQISFFQNIPEKLTLSERTAGFFCVSLPMFLITFLRPGVFGGGDIKLMAVCGFYLGSHLIINSAVIAVFLAAIYSVICILIKKADKNTTIPLGPFLSAGMLISTLWEPGLLLF